MFVSFLFYHRLRLYVVSVLCVCVICARISVRVCVRVFVRACADVIDEFKSVSYVCLFPSVCSFIFSCVRAYFNNLSFLFTAEAKILKIRSFSRKSPRS